jgi:N-hydroxyarylamine O-acetyltransferase
MPNLDALLRRVGLDAPPPPTLDGLNAVHRAFASHVPWEVLAIQLDEMGPLDVEAIAERVLHGGRGGYCFELNGLFAWMLEELGFEVQRREAVVGERGDPSPTNHLALVVSTPGGAPRIADVGMGQGAMESLPLTAGIHLVPGSLLRWTIDPRPDSGWWWGAPPYPAAPGVNIDADVVGYESFAPHHTRMSTSPESSFVQTLVLQRPYDNRFVSLRARTLFVDGPAHAERHVLADSGELAAALQDEFGIDPGALGRARITRLWEGAALQHEAWQRRRAAPAEA